MYAHENLICNSLTLENHPDNFEAVFSELNIRSQKWLICGVYKPPNQSQNEFMEYLENALTFFNYNNVIVLGDFNIDASEEKLKSLEMNFNLEMLVKQPTCFKSLVNPSIILTIYG